MALARKPTSSLTLLFRQPLSHIVRYQSSSSAIPQNDQQVASDDPHIQQRRRQRSKDIFAVDDATILNSEKVESIVEMTKTLGAAGGDRRDRAGDNRGSGGGRQGLGQNPAFTSLGMRLAERRKAAGQGSEALSHLTDGPSSSDGSGRTEPEGTPSTNQDPKGEHPSPPRDPRNRNPYRRDAHRGATSGPRREFPSNTRSDRPSNQARSRDQQGGPRPPRGDGGPSSRTRPQRNPRGSPRQTSRGNAAKPLVLPTRILDAEGHYPYNSLSSLPPSLVASPSSSGNVEAERERKQALADAQALGLGLGSTLSQNGRSLEKKERIRFLAELNGDYSRYIKIPDLDRQQTSSSSAQGKNGKAKDGTKGAGSAGKAVKQAGGAGSPSGDKRAGGEVNPIWAIQSAETALVQNSSLMPAGKKFLSHRIEKNVTP